jgi:hypothetical protein
VLILVSQRRGSPQDTVLIRSHAGTPKHVNIFGYFYNIDTGTLTEVVTDKAEAFRRV